MNKIIILSLSLLLSLSMAYAQSGPNGIGTNNIFWYKVSDLGLSNGSSVSSLTDKTSNGVNTNQGTANRRPVYSTVADEQINGEDVLVFDGNDYLIVPNHNSINMANSGYQRKTLSVVFKTSSDITSTQVLFEEGGRTNGMNLVIHNGQVYFGIYNNGNYDNYITYNITEGTNYFITGVLSANNDQLRIYVNGDYIDQMSLSNFTLKKHTGGAGIGGINGRSLFTTGTLDGTDMGFKGSLGEFVYYNDSLSTNEVDELTNFIGPDYGFSSDYESLPVELLAFEANSKGSENIIRWTTLSETNNDYFIVERSADGEYFEVLDNVEGAGNSLTELHYQISDNSPYDVSYYRLSQTDYDGTRSSSQVIRVERQSSDISTTLSMQQIQIKGSEDWIGAQITLYNSNGQSIKKYILTDRDFTIERSAFHPTTRLIVLQVQKGLRSHSQKFVL